MAVGGCAAAVTYCHRDGAQAKVQADLVVSSVTLVVRVEVAAWSFVPPRKLSCHGTG